ncbi:hypothetical protein Blut17040_08660 [Blautia luti]|uniref:Uncharacterized protein n=1 Tax=Blautia luti DSM 14534 = JCM 17040 TaxID=649762 RepID=A0A844GJZ1_9FIRM|nr:hypothetical protein [Blautia luti]MTD62406.1 hypothetical protein [Blautia luti DSM 14534 = JCM 17040]BEI59837.1 hypothetical protein Blut17040_08660 [Blautia luti]
MSQKKVDAYKSKKLHRGKADKKEKVLFTLEMFAWAFICVVIIAWIGYSAYVKVTGTKEDVVQNTVMDTSALDNYMSSLTTDSTDTEDSDSTEADETDSTEDAEDVTDSTAEDTSSTDASEDADTTDETASADDTSSTEDTAETDAE